MPGEGCALLQVAANIIGLVSLMGSRLIKAAQWIVPNDIASFHNLTITYIVFTQGWSSTVLLLPIIRCIICLFIDWLIFFDMCYHCNSCGIFFSELPMGSLVWIAMCENEYINGMYDRLRFQFDSHKCKVELMAHDCAIVRISVLLH